MLRPGTFALTALLAALTAIGPLTTDMYLPSLPDIARQLSATTAEVQLTISFYLVGFAIGQIFHGPVSDRYGRKVALTAALALYAAATLGCTLATSIEMLIAGRAMQGVGGSGGIVLARAIVRDLYAGPRAGRELSLMASVMALAPAVAPIVGGALQAGFGWRSVFIVLLVTISTIGGVVWLLLPETNERRTAEPLSPRSMLQSYAIVIRNPAYRAYLAIAAFAFAGLFAWISGASFVLQNLYGLPPFEFGLVFALGAVGYMAAAMMSARVVTRLGLDGLVGVGCGFCTAGGLGMVAVVALGFASGIALMLPMMVYLAGLAMVLGQSIAGAMTPFPERAGAASSLFGFVQQSLAAVCGAIVGVTLGQTAWPLAIVIAVLGCGTLVLWLLTRDVRRAAAKH